MMRVQGMTGVSVVIPNYNGEQLAQGEPPVGCCRLSRMGRSLRTDCC